MATLHDVILQSRVLDLGPLPAPRLSPNATVQQALQMLTRARRGAVVVVEGSRPTGILTERDVVYRLSSSLRSREDRRVTPLREVMSRPPVIVRRQDDLADALGKMVGRKHRHLVVVDGQGDLRGLLTANDIVQFLADHFPEETMNLPPRLHQQYQDPGGA